MAKGIKGSSPSEENRPVKTSIVLLPATMKKVRYMALMEEREISSIIDEALQEKIKQYEKKNGPIPLK
jgi:hypothetical protein